MYRHFGGACCLWNCYCELFLCIFLHSTLCRHYHTSALVVFVIYFKIVGMCSVLLCLHVDEHLSGSEEEAISWCKILNIFYDVFCFFTVRCTATEHITKIKCDVFVGQQMLYKKLSFKNKLSFHRFYIFRDFIFISIGPLRKKVWISLFGLEEWIKL